MKILLTGATGFLGRRVLADFLNNAHQVIVTKRRNSNIELLPYDIAQCILWDIDVQDTSKIFETHKDIDAIVHTATDYGHDNVDLTSPFWTNEVFPLQLLELAIKYHVKLFINTDTFFNTGKNDYDYLRSYTLSKRHFQEWGQYCAEMKKIAFVNLKLFHLYGPGDNANKFVPTIIKRCFAGEQIDLTDGLQRRDFIYIDDVITAFNLMLQQKFNLGYYPYEVGTGQSYCIREFIEIINALCNNNAMLNFGVLPTRIGEPKEMCANPAALKVLGWQPQFDIRKGLQIIIKEFNSNR